MGEDLNEKVDPSIITDIWSVICDRAKNPIPDSYTYRLLKDPKGIDKVLEKVGEESIEFIISVKNGASKQTTEEAADLIFHLLVALRAADIDLEDVLYELKHRQK